MQTKTYNPRKEKAELVITNWYNALKQIKDRNGRVGRMSEFIRARNESPFEDNIWRYGAYASTGLDYAPQNQVLLLKYNSESLMILENAEKAVNAHRNGKEYSKTRETYDSHLKQAEKESKKAPEKRSILVLPERKNFKIDSQTHFDVLRFLAENPREAEKYLGRLSEKGIEQIDFYLRNKYYVDKQESPFTDQLWLHRLDFRSGFNGSGGGLGYVNGVLGVFDKTAEGSSRKIATNQKKLPYSSKEAVKIYNIVEQIRKGNIKISALESKLSQVSSFLENLSK